METLAFACYSSDTSGIGTVTAVTGAHVIHLADCFTRCLTWLILLSCSLIHSASSGHQHDLCPKCKVLTSFVLLFVPRHSLSSPSTHEDSGPTTLSRAAHELSPHWPSVRSSSPPRSLSSLLFNQISALHMEHSPSPCLLAYLAPSHSLSSFFPLALLPSTKLLMILYHSCQLQKWPFIWLKAVTVMEKPEALALNRPGFKIWLYKHLYFYLRFPFMCENDNYLIRSLLGLNKVIESANNT